jgi:hypothetical protein
MTASTNDNAPETKPNEPPEPTNTSPFHTLPSAFDILLFGATLTKRHANELYGYVSYLLFPLLLLLGVQGLTGTVGQISILFVNILFAVISCWATAAIMITISYRTSHPEKTPDPRSVGAHALRLLGWLVIAVSLSSLIQIAGYILLIVPGIITTILLTFTSQEIVLAGHGPLSALAASRARVQPHFFAVAWRLLAIALSFGIIYSIVGGALVLVGSLFTGASISSIWWQQAPVWLDTLLTLLQVALLPPMVCAHTVLYLSVNSGKVAEK